MMYRTLEILVLLAALAPLPASSAEPPVTALAFAPDGKSLVVGSQRGVRIHMWPDLRRLEFQPETRWPVTTIGFSPDGRSVALGGGLAGELGELRVYDYPGWDLRWSNQSHDDLIYDVAWHPDGNRLATASHDGSVRLWDRAGAHEGTLAEHSAAVTGVAYLPDGQLVSCSRDATVRVWNTESAAVARTFTNHSDEVLGVSLRPQDSGLPMVASIGRDATIRFWQPSIGRLVRFAQLKDAPPVAAAWTPDGEMLAIVTRSGDLLQVKPATADTELVHRAAQSWPSAIAIHPSGRDIVLGGHAGGLERVRLP